MNNNRFINPSGFPENLPAEQLVEDVLKETFAKTATSYGYTHLETASVEYMDTLASKGEVDKEIYTIGRALAEGGSHEEADRGLHFDLTVPFARYVAQHQGDLWFPYRRFQVQKVWRGERPQKGRFREFYQADVDIVARETLPLACDAEVALLMAEVLSAFDIGAVTIHINNRKFLNGLFAVLNVTATTEALQAIDKLDKISEEKVRILLHELGVSPTSIDTIFSIIAKPVMLQDVSTFLDAVQGDDELLAEGKSEVRQIMSLIAHGGNVPNVRFVFNPRIARGLDYYTGTVYETTIDGLERYGSICSGGRYADLAGRFTNQKLPGVGLSIGLTRLLAIIKEEELRHFTAKSVTDVAVCLLSEAQLPPSITAADTLRRHGLNTEINYKHNIALGKQIEQARERGIPYALVREADGLYTLFNIASEAKQTYPTLEDLVRVLTT